jgi:hypothetical protein
MAPEALISQIAAMLAASGHSGVVTEFEALPGGGNNRVYRVRAGDEDFAAKHYFHEGAAERDRRHAEYAFSEHAWRCGIRAIARPVATHAEAHLALYEFVAGRRIEPQDIELSRVEAAARFFAILNSQASRSSASMLPLAADACLTVSQHVRSVDARIVRLASISPADSTEREARALVAQIAARWSAAREQILRAVPNAEAALGDRCLSPSDFGFHNALLRPGGDLCFLDFEYAGWDDPAKLVGDFFSHVGMQPARRHYERFIELALAPFPGAHAIARRVRLLSAAFRTRWACIALNEFVPEVARRRGFAAGASATAKRRRGEQITKARALLAEDDF